jgi:hypothetical protein
MLRAVPAVARDRGRGVRPDAGFYDPTQLINAYKLPSTYKGGGQFVAIVDA